MTADWFVAGGTLALAVATGWLGWQARNEARSVAKESLAVGEQVRLQRDQLVAAQRPLVVPIRGDDQDFAGVPHLVIQNAGPGAAVNVRGAIYWTGGAGGTSSLHPQVLAPGASAEAKVLGEGIAVNWANVSGYLRYHDVSGTEWQTHFRLSADGYGNIAAHVLATGLTDDLDEPAYNSEQGWVNRPENVLIS